MAGSSQWMMAAADVDGNGHCDVMTGGVYDGIKLAKADNMGGSYDIATLPNSSMFAQAANFADINNDGHIDIFVCHDDAESQIWGNDGTGNFELSNDWIDMATTPASDNSGNYGSIWTDFDNDGDLDLYIAKCRQGVGDPTDPRRINALFVNDGNSNYTEMAGEYGLKIGAQSWTADFGDIDNDGDLDCFITNHDQASMLLENDGTGYFTDITDGAGINISGTPIQGVFRDFDNDGFVDILVAGGEANLFHNNGDQTFTKVEDVFDSNDMESYAIGDLNHDGFQDVYGGYGFIYTTPSDIDDVLWLNDGNDNNYITVQLTGTMSNPNAIGAKVEIHGPWGIQVREVRAGESYGIQNSMQLHFGLGQEDMIDQMVVRWPSGTVNIFDDVTGNQCLQIIEECTAPEAIVEADGPTTFCTGENVVLEAPPGLIYEWSTGDVTQTITVTEAGNYYVLVSEDGSCFEQSDVITITVDPVEIPTIEALGETKFCEGGSVMLTSSVANSYEWSNGDQTQTTTITESGTYYVSAEGMCDFYDSETIEVTVYDPVAPMGDDVTIHDPESVTLEVTGDNPSWYDEEVGGSLLTTGNMYTTPVLDATTTYWVEDLDVFDGGLTSTGMPEITGGNPYSGNQYNGQVIFDAFETFTIKTVDVTTDTEGGRRIILLDENDEIAHLLDVYLFEGETTLTLDFLVVPGNNYKLTTDQDVNISELGYNSPRMTRASQDVDYPYYYEDLLEITGSNLGDTRYYYFFNMQVEKDGIECLSDRAPITVVFDPTIATGDVPKIQRELKVVPNPVLGDRVNLVFDRKLSEDTEARFFAADGSLASVCRLPAGQDQYEVSLNTSAGFYVVKVIAGNVEYIQKVVVQ